MSSFRMTYKAARTPSGLRRGVVHMLNPRLGDVYCGEPSATVEVSSARGVTCRNCRRAMAGPSGKATSRWSRGEDS